MNGRIIDTIKVGFYISVLTIISAVLIQLTASIFSNEEQEAYKYFYYDFPMFVLFSPVLESMFSILILSLCVAFIGQKSSCIALGLVWSGLHSTMGSSISSCIGLWLIAFIAFYLYGWLYFKYHSPNLLINVFVVTFPHSLHNFYVYLLFILIA